MVTGDSNSIGLAVRFGLPGVHGGSAEKAAVDDHFGHGCSSGGHGDEFGHELRLVVGRVVNSMFRLPPISRLSISPEVCALQQCPSALPRSGMALLSGSVKLI